MTDFCNLFVCIVVQYTILNIHLKTIFVYHQEEEGNIEYKLKLVNPTPTRLEHLVTQMKWRLEEGNGEAIYEIGVEDNGILTGLNESDLQASLSSLEIMSRR